jgi:uncharacterized membrane protein YwzB
MKRQPSNVVIILMVVGLMVGCANFKKNAYSTLDSTRIAVDTAMKIAGDLYTQDIINEQQKDDIIIIHDKYRAIHQMLCELLKMYDALDKDEVAKKPLQEQIEIALVELSKLATEISNIVTKYLQQSTGK